MAREREREEERENRREKAADRDSPFTDSFLRGLWQPLLGQALITEARNSMWVSHINSGVSSNSAISKHIYRELNQRRVART